ncbi:MAG: hypothetical protein OXE50_00320, partial [Chloroflexi bacterium]|nr:hypothetical protein [Chloroflexota bacterium]
MFRKHLTLMTVIVVVGLVGLLSFGSVTAQTNPSATRSFDSTSVASGGTLVVTIAASGYGQAGGVTETLPAGFAYVSSSLDTSQVNVNGQQVRFTLQGDTSFTYTVTASSTPGSHTFSGTLRDFARDDHTVGGASSVTVEAASTATPEPSPTASPQGPAPSASRAFSSSSVVAGAAVTVTVTAANYGQAGGVTETLPAGFAYVSSSLDANQVNVSGQTVRFTLQGDTSFTYSVTASSTPVSYTFSGTLRDFDRNDHTVGGASSVTVRAAPGSVTPRANRAFSSSSVLTGAAVTATITATNYGQAGGVTETLPAGFAYVSSSLDANQVNVSGQTVRFTLQGDTSFTYTVTASSMPGSYTFSGTLRDFDRNDHTVGGASRITVRAAPGSPTPSARRSFSPASVAQGGEVVVAVTVANYGQAGGGTEKLPAGFAYVSSRLYASQGGRKG